MPALQVIARKAGVSVLSFEKNNQGLSVCTTTAPLGITVDVVGLSLCEASFGLIALLFMRALVHAKEIQH